MDIDRDEVDFEPGPKAGIKGKVGPGLLEKRSKRKKGGEAHCETSILEVSALDYGIDNEASGEWSPWISCKSLPLPDIPRETLEPSCRQLAPRVSSEEDPEGHVEDRDDGFNVTGSVVVVDAGSASLGGGGDNAGPSTVAVPGEEDGGEASAREVSARGGCEQIVVEDSYDEETEAVDVVRKKFAGRISTGESTDMKNIGSTREMSKRIKKKPWKLLASGESDEGIEETKEEKQAETVQVPSQKTNKITAGKKSATSRPSENIDVDSSEPGVPEEKVSEENCKDQPAPAAPVRPSGVDNIPSSSRNSVTPSSTPTPSISLPVLMDLKTDTSSSNPHRCGQAWKSPAKVDSRPADSNKSSSLPVSPGLSPGQRRIGLSRHWKSPAPLHRPAKQ